jgi:endoglucanase
MHTLSPSLEETPNEWTSLISRQQPLDTQLIRRCRYGKWIYILIATCGVVVFYTLIYMGINSGSMDQRPLPPPQEIHLNMSIPVSKYPEFQPPFRVEWAQIVDMNNSTVRLKSVNWYGASDIYFVPSGLDIQHRDNISTLIRRMGFNSVRLPYSDEMVVNNPMIAAENLVANPDLVGLRALDIYTAVVESLTAAGLLVVINNHITQATWCCGANLCDASWSNDWLGPLCRVRQTEDGWIQNWATIMHPLVNNRLVIGLDLRNEVRGLWGTMRWDMWAAAAERAAETLLRMNQDWLIIVGGTSSGNDLSGVKKRPVKLSVPGRVVYSAHVYSWSGWGELAPYSKTSYEQFALAMKKNWGYIIQLDIAPVWVGEFGGPSNPSKGDLNYWQNLIRFLVELENAHWGYWAINPNKPAKNETESYGLVQGDWTTVKWDYRMQDLLDLGLNFTQLRDVTD